MFPASFDYACRTSLQEALGLLAEHGDEAKVMAGGQSLIPLLKLRLAAPGVVVDIGRVPGLAGIDADAGGLTIGARTRHVDVERSVTLKGLYPIVAEAAPQIPAPLVRNAGSVGGSICPAEPARAW